MTGLLKSTDQGNTWASVGNGGKSKKMSLWQTKLRNFILCFTGMESLEDRRISGVYANGGTVIATAHNDWPHSSYNSSLGMSN